MYTLIHADTTQHSNSFKPTMADNTGDVKPTPSADQTASSEPRLAQDETKLATHPTENETVKNESSASELPNKPSTITDMASNAASTAASTAAGVKDSVFSMFGGGGPKKEKPAVEEDEDAKNEPSGSSKAKKEDDEVSCFPRHSQTRSRCDCEMPLT